VQEAIRIKRERCCGTYSKHSRFQADRPTSISEMYNNKKNGVALIGSGHVNAVGIALSLREIGWPGRIICAAPPGSISELYPGICETVHANWTQTENFFDYLARVATEETSVHVFLTDEALLDSIETQQGALTAANINFFPKIKNSWAVVTDRRQFYNFVSMRGLAEVPEYVDHCSNPWEIFPSGFRARVWKSWKYGKKLPRGMNVTNIEELRRWLKVADGAGLQPGDWAFQKLLSRDPRDNISVCGWHDENLQLYFITRKLAQRHDVGAMVERVRARDELQKQTKSILISLGFEGVFELEFVRDPSNDQFKVLELNPRFWMQHRLIEKLTGNALVRLHIGQQLDNCRRHVPQRGIWIDSTSLLLLLRIWPIFHIIKNWPLVCFATPTTAIVRYQVRGWIALLRIRCRAGLREGLRRILRQPS
jgi:hypothetical protein